MVWTYSQNCCQLLAWQPSNVLAGSRLFFRQGACYKVTGSPRGSQKLPHDVLIYEFGRLQDGRHKFVRGLRLYISDTDILVTKEQSKAKLWMAEPTVIAVMNWPTMCDMYIRTAFDTRQHDRKLKSAFSLLSRPHE